MNDPQRGGFRPDVEPPEGDSREDAEAGGDPPDQQEVASDPRRRLPISGGPPGLSQTTEAGTAPYLAISNALILLERDPDAHSVLWLQSKAAIEKGRTAPAVNTCGPDLDMTFRPDPTGFYCACH